MHGPARRRRHAKLVGRARQAEQNHQWDRHHQHEDDRQRRAIPQFSEPTLIGHRRIPGLKLHDDRLIRLLETLLHPGGFVANWTTRELHARILARHHLADGEYRLSQLRYDLAKLRAKGMVQRLGTRRRYRLTPLGLKLGVLLVKLRTRLLGPLATLVSTSSLNRQQPRPNSVDAAFREVDTALDHLAVALGLMRAA